MIRFSDGVSFDTSGPLRATRRNDGWYVVGCGTLMPVADYQEARRVLEREAKRAALLGACNRLVPPIGAVINRADGSEA